MRLVAIGFVAACLSAAAAAQDARTVPRFRDFPARMFEGRNAPIVLTGEQRLYRTRLRAAVSQRPNFAGRFVVVTWGCGTSCITGAVYDALSGSVVAFPFSLCCWRDVDQSFQPIEFRRDSRLIVFAGLRNEAEPMGAHFYEFTGSGFRHLLSVPDSGDFRR